MEIKQLEYFRAIVDEGTISGAARALHMTQPPLSYQMKMLEEENLGCAFPSTSVYFETPLVQKQAAPPTDAPKTEVQA